MHLALGLAGCIPDSLQERAVQVQSLRPEYERVQLSHQYGLRPSSGLAHAAPPKQVTAGLLYPAQVAQALCMKP